MTRRRVDGEALTVELAVRLDAIVPRDAVVRARGPQLWVEAPAPGAWGGENIAGLAEQDDDPEGPDRDGWIAYARERALEGVQEILMVSWLHEIWPLRPGASGTEPPDPDPHAAVRGDRIHLWYGPEEDPVLALEPIPLERVIRPLWRSRGG
jgi:hypothetical protein